MEDELLTSKTTRPIPVLAGHPVPADVASAFSTENL